MTAKRCRCTADMRLVDGEMRCPYSCPPKAPKVAPKSIPEPQRERGFNWQRNVKPDLGGWRAMRGARVGI